MKLCSHCELGYSISVDCTVNASMLVIVIGVGAETALEAVPVCLRAFVRRAGRQRARGG